MKTGRKFDLLDLARVASLGLATASVLSLNSDIVGLAACGIAVLLMAITTSCYTTAVVLLMFGPKMLGLLFQILGSTLPGTVVALVLTVVALGISSKKISIRGIDWVRPSAWISACLLIFCLAYLYGPQTEYSWSKLTGFCLGFLFTTVGLLLLKVGDGVSPREVGLLGLVASAAYFSEHLYLFPQMRPTSIFEFGGMRMTGFSAGEVVDANNIASAASTSLMLLFSPIVREGQAKSRVVIAAITVVLGVALLGITGQRLFVVGAPVALILAFLTTPHTDKRLTLIAAGVMVAFLAAIGYYSRENLLISQVTDSERVHGKINREVNWDAAVSLISESPVLGHGLGGYYIDGISVPGSGTYPHNLLLELMTETGAMGTLFIVLPAFYLSWSRCRPVKAGLSPAALSVWAVLILAAIHSMISHDLTVSSSLFSVIFVGAATYGRRSGRSWPQGPWVTKDTAEQGVLVQDHGRAR